VTFIAFDDSRAIRILNPVNIYAPDAPTPSPVPTDYLAYLMSLRAQGAKLTDRKRTTVDGHNATVLTEGATRSLDGTLGCQKPNLDSGKCFGIQPEFIARLAVIDTAKGPLLIWVRLNAHAHPGMATEAANFDKLLASVRFAS
jgi:hypothetical protein